MAVPGLVCTMHFAFTLPRTNPVLDEFIRALTFASSSEEIAASVGVTGELTRGDIHLWGQPMAGAALGSVPIVIRSDFLLDHHVSGLTAGAVE